MSRVSTSFVYVKSGLMMSNVFVVLKITSQWALIASLHACGLLDSSLSLMVMCSVQLGQLGCNQQSVKSDMVNKQHDTWLLR